MNKVIFLDLDGVLNTPTLVLQHDKDYLDPAMTARVRLLATLTGARIVISSSWRFLDDTPFHLAKAGFLPEEMGAALSRKYENREEAIKEYLSLHTTDAWVILDDFDGYFKDKSHLVVTDGLVGLTGPDVLKAWEILNP